MIALNHQVIQMLSERLAALSDPVRLRIMCLLKQHDFRVKDLVEALEYSQASVSKHLSILKRAGFVDCRREANAAWYFLADPAVEAICDLLMQGLRKRIGAHHEALARTEAQPGEEKRT